MLIFSYDETFPPHFVPLSFFLQSATCTSPTMHLIWPQNFAQPLFFISRGYYIRPNAYAKFWGFANAIYSTYYDNLFEFSVPLNFRTAIHSSSTTWEVITISLSNLNLWLLKSYKFEVFEAFAKVIFWLRLLYLCCCERFFHTTENTRDNCCLLQIRVFWWCIPKGQAWVLYSVYLQCVSDIRWKIQKQGSIDYQHTGMGQG